MGHNENKKKTMSFCVNKAGTNHPARVSGLAMVQGGSAVGKGLEVCATCVHFSITFFFSSSLTQ